MILYLNKTQIAHHIGIQPTTINKYQLPEPDAKIGNQPGWLTQTINTWNQQRPGKGRQTTVRSTTSARKDT